MNSENRIHLAGKVSKVGKVKYTPRGVPLYEFTLAVPQALLGVENFGYFEVMVQGEEALSLSHELQVGKEIGLEGSLWTRKYKGQNQKWSQEFKVILSSIRRTQ